MKRYITESGAEYVVGQGGWEKNGYHEGPLHWLNAVPDIQPRTFEGIEKVAEDRPPVVGERLFIGNRDVWYLSTAIERIEDVS